MKQSNQSTQSIQGDPDKPRPVRPSPGQSFSDTYRRAMEWSGAIHTKKQRKINMSMFMGEDMAQGWPDLLIWEAFFNSYPIKTFIELGTGHGGLALFFALQCYQRGISFDTFDNVNSFKGNDALPVLIGLKENFHHVDIFKEGAGIISNLITAGPHPVAIFFDDGDKPREWRTFAPLTSKGDFLIVHDWGTEFGEQDIGDVPVQRILGNMSDSRPDGWKAMWFQRT